MRVQKLPFKRGFYWLVEGGGLWWRNPALMTFLSFSYLLVLTQINQLPFIGPALASISMPILLLIVLNGCHVIEQGVRVHPKALIAGLERKNLKSLFSIGVVYFLCQLFMFGLLKMLAGESIKRLEEGVAFSQVLADKPEALTTFLGVGTLIIPVMMAYWFAPMLCGWWRLPALKALFFSFYACLQNWHVFVVFAISLLVFGGVIPQLIMILIGGFLPQAGLFLLLVLLLVCVPSVFAAFYISVREVFGFPSETV